MSSDGEPAAVELPLVDDGDPHAGRLQPGERGRVRLPLERVDVLASQTSALSRSSVPGTRVVKPTRPCPPGTSPVPSEVRLVEVVDGTPAVPIVEVASSEWRYGAASAWRSQQVGAEPVDQEHDVRRRTRQVQPARSAAPSG